MSHAALFVCILTTIAKVEWLNISLACAKHMFANICFNLKFDHFEDFHEDPHKLFFYAAFKFFRVQHLPRLERKGILFY